jgi:hypothetical protein
LCPGRWWYKGLHLQWQCRREQCARNTVWGDISRLNMGRPSRHIMTMACPWIHLAGKHAPQQGAAEPRGCMWGTA